MLGSLFKVGKSHVENEEASAPHSPFKGLKVGKRLYFDNTEIKLFQSEMLLDISTAMEDMVVEAQSKIELGVATFMERFYVDEGYFQVLYEGKPDMANVTEWMFVSYDASEGFGDHNIDELEALKAKMLADTYIYRDKTFTQSMKSEFNEKVLNSMGQTYDVYNHVAVFSRELSHGLVETLIVALEDCDGLTASFALGIVVPSTSLEVSLA